MAVRDFSEGAIPGGYFADILPTYLYAILPLNISYSLYFYGSAVLIALSIYLLTRSVWSVLASMIVSSAILGFYPTGTIPNAWVIFGLGSLFWYFLLRWLQIKSMYYLVGSLILLTAVGLSHSVALGVVGASLLVALPVLTLSRRIAVGNAVLYAILALLILLPTYYLVSTYGNTVSAAPEVVKQAPVLMKEVVDVVSSVVREFPAVVVESPPSRWGHVSLALRGLLSYSSYQGAMLVVSVGMVFTVYSWKRRIPLDNLSLVLLSIVGACLIALILYPFDTVFVDRVGRVIVGTALLLTGYWLSIVKDKGIYSLLGLLLFVLVLISLPEVLDNWWSMTCKVC